MRYAQEVRGQRLHLVKETDPELDGGRIALRALCGRCAPNGWRMTCNLPLANSCKNCNRVWASRFRKGRLPR